jgi:phenylacetate-CoA ligase
MGAMNHNQLRLYLQLLEKVEKKTPFYQKKFGAIGLQVGDIKTYEDIKKLPFTTKEELREAYPLGLLSVDESEVVRIHSSSGTTGKPVIIPYTRFDIEIWSLMMARCLEFAGVTSTDRVQITPGYGLWTAGIGFQAGVEKLGAIAIPTGPGNTEKQLEMLLDLQSTVLCATSSYALLLAEEVARRGLLDQIALKRGIIGSERWGMKMRNRIADELGIELHDIYGLTEIYGPGISIECDFHTGLHYWDDYLFFEIIDPETGEVLPDGELGELVITTLRKDAAPLIRYRTRDLTRIIPGTCPCGVAYPRHDVILGRTDDMIKVKGVNVYPGQIDELLREIEGVSSEYQVLIDTIDAKVVMTLMVEKENGVEALLLEKRIKETFRQKVGFKIEAKVLPIGELPRSEKKSTRVIDRRYE